MKKLFIFIPLLFCLMLSDLCAHGDQSPKSSTLTVITADYVIQNNINSTVVPNEMKDLVATIAKFRDDFKNHKILRYFMQSVIAGHKSFDFLAPVALRNFSCTNEKIDKFKELYRFDPALLLLTNSKGNNALLLACKHGHMDIVQYLVNNGTIDLNTFKNNRKKNALHKACKKSGPELINLLLSQNCSLLEKDYKNCTPLMIALENENIEGAMVLLKNVMSHSLQAYKKEVSKMLNEFDRYGNSYLFKAIVLEEPDLVELMIKLGAQVNQPIHNCYPIQLARELNNNHIVTILLNNGSINLF